MALPGLSLANLGSTPGSTGARRSGARRRPEQPGQQTQQQPQAQSQPQTFSQMQQAGIARPAPPMQRSMQAAQQIPQYRGSEQANKVRGDLQGAVSQALAAPSRYDTQTFNTIRDAARGDLSNQFARIRSSTDENMARRGLAASSIAANEFRDVDSDERRALANLDATLLQQAANTQAADRQAAYGMGSDLAGLAGSQDLAQYNANANATNQNFQNQLAQMLGLGNLSLGQQQLEQSGSQFDRSLDQQKLESGQQYGLAQMQQQLAERLGLGNLDLNKQQLAQSGSQFDRSLAQQQTDSDRQYGLQQQQLGENTRQFDIQQELAKALGFGNLDLSRQQLAQTGSQFDRSFAQQQADSDRQYGLQKQSQADQNRQFDLQQQLAQTLGLGNLDLQKQAQANQSSQFAQDLGLRQQALTQEGSQFDKTFGLQSEAQRAQNEQFQKQLEQQLGLAQMSDNTQNRGLSMQERAAQLDTLTRLLENAGSLPATQQQQLVDQIRSILGGSSGNTSGTGRRAFGGSAGPRGSSQIPVPILNALTPQQQIAREVMREAQSSGGRLTDDHLRRLFGGNNPLDN